MSSISKTKSMIIKPDKISYKILQWMQEHENGNELKKTTGHIIAGKICELPDVENGELTIEQTFSKMIKCDIIYRDQYEKTIYSNYRINYWHKSIPAEILANAPVEVKRAMAKKIDDMTPNQYMDDEGCIVTPNAVEKTGDPFSEDETMEETDLSKHATAIADMFCGDAVVPREVIEPEQEEKPTTQEVSVPVEVKKDGKTMSITVNLTINL